MGLIDKVKNLFTEEVIEEEPFMKPIKREKVKEEEPVKEVIKEPIKEEVKKIEPPVMTREEKTRTPVYFDDNAFSDLKGFENEKKEEPKRVREVKVIKRTKNENSYKGNTKEEIPAKKIFKPSPIISPVYGVLDKNYKKDDVKTKVRKEKVKITPTIDDVRAKAYGPNDDDLDNTLFTSGTLSLDAKEIKKEEKKESFKDMKLDKEIDNADLTKELELQRQKIDEINEYIKNNSVVKKKEPVINKEEDEDVGNELFDLIDSMYEKRDEE